MIARTLRGSAAFTLIELLVAIGLMIILMGAVALIFFQSTDLFKTSESRMQIANSARTALDMLSRDLAGSLPTDNGGQCFTMWQVPSNPDGLYSRDNGQYITDGVGNRGPADAIQFWATTSYRGTVSGVHITYYTVESTDPEIMTTGGQATGARTGRQLMAVRRIARQRNGAAWVNPPDDADLCEYVVGFNIEALVDPDDSAATGQAPRFMNLNDNSLGFRVGPNYGPGGGNPYDSTALMWWSKFAHPPAPGTPPYTYVPPVTPSDPVLQNMNPGIYPIGCQQPAPRNPVPIPKVPMAIRVTMRIVEGAAEKQERLISRVIWIPIQ